MEKLREENLTLEQQMKLEQVKMLTNLMANSLSARANLTVTVGTLAAMMLIVASLSDLLEVETQELKFLMIFLLFLIPISLFYFLTDLIQ